MVNYQLGKIYQITSPQTDSIYVGSTACELLSQRMAKHRQGFNNYLNNGTGDNLTSFELLKYADSEITLLETYPCNNKDELHAREGFWLKKLRKDGVTCVNKLMPGASVGMSKREYDRKRSVRYRRENAGKVKARTANYYQKNKAYITNYDYWRRKSPIGILARAYFDTEN